MGRRRRTRCLISPPAADEGDPEFQSLIKEDLLQATKDMFDVFGELVGLATQLAPHMSEAYECPEFPLFPAVTEALTKFLNVMEPVTTLDLPLQDSMFHTHFAQAMWLDSSVRSLSQAAEVSMHVRHGNECHV